MYIDPFWAGVLATLLFEFVAMFFAALYLGGRKKK
jgi:hypothetical protein